MGREGEGERGREEERKRGREEERKRGREGERERGRRSNRQSSNHNAWYVCRLENYARHLAAPKRLQRLAALQQLE